MSTISYRADIDGLRALAVMSVVLYHAGAPFISGGFIGVDIFFVISGFLITSIIYSELTNSTFSFKNFWLRRARRILPASYLVMFSTLIVFAFVYPVIYFKDLSLSLAAQSVFGANFYFWSSSGYFESAAELKPLLHTWSLAVEEQFYLFFPFFLWLLHRYLRQFILVITGLICLLSLALCVWASNEMADAAFYLLPTRAWELGVGAMLALAPHKYFTGNQLVTNAISILSLGLISYGLVTLSSNSPFPSYNALIPVLGTAGLIWANSKNQTWIGSFFSLKLIVGVGLISYSLYLWHWPVIVLSKWLFEIENLPLYTLVVTSISIVFAYATYRWVETPFRKNRTLFTNRVIVKSGLCVTSLLLLMGIGANQFSNSALVDPNLSIQQFYEAALEPEPNRACSDRVYTGRTDISCQVLGNPDTKAIDFFVWGDSYASAITPAFIEMAENENYNIEYALHNGCPPAVGLRRVDRNFMCPEFNRLALERAIRGDIKTVIFVSSFVRNLSIGKIRDVDASKLIDPKQAQKEFSQRFSKTISQLKAAGVKVVVVTEPPYYEIDPVTAQLKLLTLGKEETTPLLTRDEHLDRIEAIYAMIDETSPDTRLDYTDMFCPEKNCVNLHQGMSLYKDKGHISNYGARYLYPYILNDLKKISEKDQSTARESN